MFLNHHRLSSSSIHRSARAIAGAVLLAASLTTGVFASSSVTVAPNPQAGNKPSPLNFSQFVVRSKCDRDEDLALHSRVIRTGVVYQLAAGNSPEPRIR